MTHTATPANTPANTAVTSFKVHPLGFSAFEKSTIETFFRLAARRPPFWSVTPRVEDATVLLLNAATGQEYEALARRMSPTQKAVIVGATDLAAGWPMLPRPLKLTALLTSLSIFVPDDASAAVPAALAPPPQPPVQPPVQAPVFKPDSGSTYNSGFIPLHAPEPAAAPLSKFGPASSSVSLLPVAPAKAWESAASPGVSRFATVAATRAVEISTDTFGLLGTQRSHAVSAVIAARKVLIVDDSDVALKFMQSRLRQFGYESKLARSGEEALAMTESDDYQFVFLDVMMAGLDGYQTCRAIKQNKGKRATIPAVVMLTSRGGTIDKIRGSMSGCDAYLTKPLNEQQLGMVLAQHATTSIKKAAPPQNATRPAAASPMATYVSKAPSRVAVIDRSP